MDKTFILDILEKCIIRWGTEEEKSDFAERSERWLSCVNNDSEKKIFLELLSNFNYYSQIKMSAKLRFLYQKIQEKVENYEYTMYLPLPSERGRINNSYEVLSLFRRSNKINKDLCIPELERVITSKWFPNIKNIIFIDDAIGTGKTTEKSVAYVKKRFSKIFDKKVYLAVIEANQAGEIYLGKSILDIEVICLDVRPKAFSEGYIFSDLELNRAKNIVAQYELLVNNDNIDSDYYFGYEDSQALLAFYYDTPNNTLSTFWKQDRDMIWCPLFPREISNKPSWMKETTLQSKQRFQKDARKNLEILRRK